MGTYRGWGEAGTIVSGVENLRPPVQSLLDVDSQVFEGESVEELLQIRAGRMLPVAVPIRSSQVAHF